MAERDDAPFVRHLRSVDNDNMDPPAANPRPKRPNIIALNQLQVRALLAHFRLRATAENRALVHAMRWVPRWPRSDVQGVYALVDTTEWWMRVGLSQDVWRRCFIDHDRALRRGAHSCMELQNDCRGIDGARWRVLLLETVSDSFVLRRRERWWRGCLEREFEREEHRSRWLWGFTNRRPAD
jgi:hypothetical protein